MKLRRLWDRPGRSPTATPPVPNERYGQGAELIDAVDEALERQLAGLSTAETARLALANGGAVLCHEETEVLQLANAIAPEHLQLSIEDPERLSAGLKSYGTLFLGDRSAEVFGDYGAGPNHVLPTGGAARYSGELSVLAFLRMRHRRLAVRWEVCRAWAVSSMVSPAK